MKASTLVLVFVPLISAHTRFTTLFVNSKSQGDGVCIRMDMNPSTTTDWIPGLSSPEMACGVQGNDAVDRTCPLNAGDSISLLHRLWTDGSQPGSIDPSHKGSTAVYMKKIADASSPDPYSTQASGDGWFKIAWEGYDATSEQWGTEKMIANGGLVSAIIPSDLAAGYYLIRSEVLALQNIVDGSVQPQFYAGCAQVYLSNSGAGGGNPETVSIPGYINDQTPALSYDIYATTKPAKVYEEFGPKAYTVESVSAKALLEKRRDRKDDDDSSALWASFSRWASRHRPWGNSKDYDSANQGPSTDSSGNTLINVVDDNSGASAIPDFEYSGGSTTDDNVTSLSVSRFSVTTRVNIKSSTAEIDITTTFANNAAKSTRTPASASTSPPSPSSPSSSSIPIGSCPHNTILEVANQCLTALETWSADTPGSLPKCWAASQKCWDKNEECWSKLSPAINANDQNAGCHLWENFCNQVVDWCKAGNTQGPPDAGFGSSSAAKRDAMNRRKMAIRHLNAARRRTLR